MSASFERLPDCGGALTGDPFPRVARMLVPPGWTRHWLAVVSSSAGISVLMPTSRQRFAFGL